MKKKYILYIITSLLLTGIVVNSCKKTNDNVANIDALFSNGTWQLASVMVFNYVGSTQGATDTLNTTCDTTQLFTFNSNHTCTYTNFDCVSPQMSSGNWSLSTDGLTLYSTMSCKDTVAGGGPGTTQPFANARIMNIGLYSLVLETGDVGTYYTSTTRRRIVEYGFVHKNPASN